MYDCASGDAAGALTRMRDASVKVLPSHACLGSRGRVGCAVGEGAASSAACFSGLHPSCRWAASFHTSSRCCSLVCACIWQQEDRACRCGIFALGLG
ncbi:hypothetical protein FOA52_014781 [Chlamydomonas sp. UWO 241]|nr:hypothetical protein FOA52_014781 [Chlamydomonas sp. UWO 241]